MVVAGRNEVWWPEVFLVRFTFSIYSGWITAATILNTVFMLKSWGMSDYPIVDENDDLVGWGWADVMMFMDEEVWTCVILWIAEIIYELASWSERNPVFGGVWTWALSAILYATLDERSDNIYIIINASVILVIHIISMCTLSGWLVFEELEPWYTPLSFWGGGMIGFTDWSQMFFCKFYLNKYFQLFFS